MANTAIKTIAPGVRYVRIDTDATVLQLGNCADGTVGSIVFHLYSNTTSGNGITVKSALPGAAGLSLASITADYEADNTATDGATKITAAGRYYVRGDHQEIISLSFEIAGGSWDVLWSQGPG